MPAPFIFFDRTTTADSAEVIGDFYRELFGWTVAPKSTDGPLTRSLLMSETPWGAVVESPAVSPAWVPYVLVDDLAAAIARAEALGAKVVSGPTDWTAGTAVTILDPGGAAVALWGPA